ncbi:hypothetical protein [Streptomyces chilikensis]|uniref:Secreted protein n=1 Tax=Streptomyces chilikensis TaxID=1194079 RepID=A0ABV3ERH5_9ACTN
MTRCVLILTVALVFGAVDAMPVPAAGSPPPRITIPDRRAGVSGMRFLSTRLSQVAGPPIGGPAAARGRRRGP